MAELNTTTAEQENQPHQLATSELVAAERASCKYVYAAAPEESIT